MTKQSILVYVVRQMNDNDDEETTTAFADEANARRAYSDACNVCYMAGLETERYDYETITPHLAAKIYNHEFSGWERLEYYTSPGE